MEQTPTKETAFDPCSIPDEALVSAGLDPASEVDDVGPGFVISDSNICRWDELASDPWFSVGVHFSWTQTSASFLEAAGYQDFSEVRIGDRDGLQFRTVRDDPLRGCILAVDVVGGLIVFNVLTKLTDDVRAETCELLNGVVLELRDATPPSHR